MFFGFLFIVRGSITPAFVVLSGGLQVASDGGPSRPAPKGGGVGGGEHWMSLSSLMLTGCELYR